MQRDYHDKSMHTAPAKTEKPVKAKTDVYHFAGDGKYQPAAIEAASPEEAQDKWEQARIEIK